MLLVNVFISPSLSTCIYIFKGRFPGDSEVCGEGKALLIGDLISAGWKRLVNGMKKAGLKISIC